MITKTGVFGPYIETSAVFDTYRQYRYSLWRKWDAIAAQHVVLFCGLNPSKADEFRDDPTVRREVAFAKSIGATAMVKVNLFAYIDTDPIGLTKAVSPVGEVIDHTDGTIAAWAERAEMRIAAWGALNNRPKFIQRRAERVKAILTQHGPLHCLRVTKAGYPEHPLYLPGKLKPIPFALSAFEAAR